MTNVEPWPNSQRVVGIIEEAFDFLIRDHSFAPTTAEPSKVEYDMMYMQTLTRIAVAVDLESRLLEVAISWPDGKMAPTDLEPVISLVDLVAIRAPTVDLPRDMSTEDAAQRTVDRSAELLRDLAVDVLSGGTGLFFDFLDWKRAMSDRGEDRWWGHPIYQEIADVSRPRTSKEIKLDFEFEPIHFGAHRNPEGAWPSIVAFIRRHPGTNEATTLLEDVMFSHGDAFIERIEALASTDEAIRDTIATAPPIGGIASDAVDRYNRLQEDLMKEPSPGGWPPAFLRRSRPPC
jgi:hypothetical protein